MSSQEIRATAKAVFLKNSMNGISLKRYEMCLRLEEEKANRKKLQGD